MSQEVEWEALCRQCGVSCHAAIMIDGVHVVVEGLHCVNLEDNRCKVYKERHAKAPWCLPAQVAGPAGALAEDCPYLSCGKVGLARGPSKSKTRLSAEEYDKRFPEVAAAICEMRAVASFFSWEKFFAEAARREPEYEWCLWVPTTNGKATVSRRLVPSGPSRPNPQPMSHIMLPWTKPCSIDDLSKCTLPDWNACELPEEKRCPKPLEGWEEKYKEQKSGKTVWDVPYDSTANKVVPWPVDWIPHRQLTEEDSDADKAKGFVFVESTCAVTGKELPVGVGVACLRCGKHLHPSAANMAGGFDPPYCDGCKVFVMWA
jgi:hypothetical protein